MKQVNVKVDGIGLNATAFSGKTEAEAIKQMADDSITNDQAWAKKAYAACIKAVKDAEKAEADEVQEAEDKKTKQAAKKKNEKPQFLKRNS